jgi:hypothetical protein
MSLLSRLKLIFTPEIEAYTFDKKAYASIDDFVHDGGMVLKVIYVPYYDLYFHYYDEMKLFIAYKSSEPFNENNTKYTNMKKIKINTSFVHYMLDIYEIDEDTRKFSIDKKPYFDELTK